MDNIHRYSPKLRLIIVLVCTTQAEKLAGQKNILFLTIYRQIVRNFKTLRATR